MMAKLKLVLTKRLANWLNSQDKSYLYEAELWTDDGHQIEGVRVKTLTYKPILRQAVFEAELVVPLIDVEVVGAG